MSPTLTEQLPTNDAAFSLSESSCAVSSVEILSVDSSIWRRNFSYSAIACLKFLSRKSVHFSP